jgi:Uma2 family endonuclease
MSMPLARYYAPDDVRALPDDGNRYETVHGELLVTPAPGGRHQHVLTRLIRIIDRYLEAHDNADLLASPADISFGTDTMVQPDLFVADLGVFTQTWQWVDIQSLHLVIEIVSPSSACADRITKRHLYQERRIPEYWVVDVEQRQVEVWTPDATFPVVQRERLVWRHPSLAGSCVVDVVKLLSP